MVFPVVGGTQSTDFSIANSLRFNDNDNSYMYFDNGSGGSNTAGTLSFWIKRSSGQDTGDYLDTNYMFFARSDNSNVFNCYFSADTTRRLEIRSTQGGSMDFQYKTNMTFSDTAAWYHIVIAIDTTDGTAADRCKLFVNGTRITSFNSQTNFDQNDTIEWFQSDARQWWSGEWEDGTGPSRPMENYLAEVYMLDGYQYDASYFGEFNDNGVWVPKQYSGGVYGNNGYRLEFKQTGTSANASGMGADTSGNGNHLTVANLDATDVTTDTPTNNFITWDGPSHNGDQMQHGNTFTETRNSTDRDAGAKGNIGLTRGKWYWELKIQAVGDHTYAGIINIGNRFDKDDEDYDTSSGGDDGYPLYDYQEEGKRGTNTGSGRSQTGVVQATYGDGDILNFALDLDNNKIHYGKNGTYGESSDPANNTNGIAIADGVYYTPSVVGYGSGDVFANFGNPAFSISSGNSDANGFGNFEYAPPSGYFAICTKNLAEFG